MLQVSDPQLCRTVLEARWDQPMADTVDGLKSWVERKTLKRKTLEKYFNPG